MSNQIVPFDAGQVPAFIKQANAAGLNDDLAAHAGTGFGVMSIKGKVFAIVRNGDREVLMNPKDDTSPASSVEVVIVKASPHKAKQFYLKGWQEGQDAEKPDCWSNDGIRPDSTVEVKQSPSCGTCRHNQWASKIGDKGATKGKACADSVRIAVAAPQMINEPYLMRVPPASIKALGEYGVALSKRGVGYNMVVTRISFDVDTPTPKLEFKPVGFLDEKMYDEVQETAGSEVMRKIMGIVTAGEAPVLPAPVAEVAEAVAVVEKVAEKPAPVAEPAKPAKKAHGFGAAKAEPVAAKTKTVTEAEVVAAIGGAKPAAEVVVDMEGLDLSSLTFDD